ncbi:hemin uptake protein HemP [Rhodanobacter ginsengisoli]|uniref:Hemin uptake protein HemP n=1 Tax=Rhodanobacter ginsengisoli TaxID=418646 RepID=A0ABW0QRU5_9GAMM
MSILSLRSSSPSSPSRQALPSPVLSAVPTARHITSQSLLDGARELVIQHQGCEYHLRLTRNDKLILTK